MFQRGLGGDHDLRQCRADGNHRRADQQLRQVKPARDADSAVHKPVAALDEQCETNQEKEYGYKHIHSSVRPRGANSVHG